MLAQQATTSPFKAYSVRDAAALLDISENWMRELVKTGRVRARKISERCTRIGIHDLKAFFDSCQVVGGRMSKLHPDERLALRIYQALIVAGHLMPGGDLRRRKVQATILDVLRDHVAPSESGGGTA